ncbi:MAG: hypothetical protein R8K50_05095 [Mariprofundus sp.]
MTGQNGNAINRDANGFRDALQSLKSAVGDLSSLEVQTYTGSVKLDDIQGKDGKPLSPAKFEEYLQTAIGKPADLKLVAVTRMNFDGDTINLIPEDGFPDHVQKAHESAVKAGIETRQGLLALFGGMIGLSVKDK